MSDKQQQALSKLLSFTLRHRPETLGIKLDKSGWADIDLLLAALQQRGNNITKNELINLVVHNDKQRFAVNENQTRIRANQGHSVQVDLGLEPMEPPAQLFHGTAERFLESIFKQGLKKMNRHHVHLSGNYATAHEVGARYGKPVVLIVNTAHMVNDGYSFYLSGNGVWLTDYVPVQYLAKDLYQP